MEDLSFSIVQLSEESKGSGPFYIPPKIETFSEIPSVIEKKIKSTYYEIKVEKNSDSYWFYFDFGRPDPIDTLLTNTKNGKKRSNSRKHYEAELIHQLFCYYDFEDQLLYISDIRKKNFFIDLLKEYTKTDFITKEIKKSKKEFFEILKTVDEIAFTDVKELINGDSVRRKALVDLTGTDSPHEFKISAKYSHNKLPELFNFVSSFGKNNTNNNLVICGTNERGFDLVYNKGTFNQKIPVKVYRNKDGKYDPNNVKNMLIEALEK